MDLTVGILSYNTKDLLRKCLKSIIKHTKGLSYELIIIENASHDGSLEMLKKEFPQITLIANKKNNFFAKGYNQIMKKASGKYFIMLNSDTYLKNNAFKKMTDFMKENNLPAVEGLELLPNGKPISTGSLFRTPLSDFYELSLLGRIFKNKKYIDKVRLKKFNRKKTFEIDVGCNAYMCVETKLLKDIGGYDNKFVLYYTEDDLSQRIKKKGHKIMHYANSFVIHEDAKSTMQLGWRRYHLFYKDLLTYHKKYNNALQAYFLFYLLNIELSLLKVKSFFN